MSLSRLVEAIFVLCVASATAHSQELEIKIGHAGPLTGNQANAGKDNERGVRLAVDELNSKDFRIGGKRAKFVLLSEDDQGDPKTGVVVAQELADAGVRAVIGHYNSGVTIPAAAVYNTSGIPMITGAASNPKLTQLGYSNVFRLAANDNVMGAAMAEFAASRGLKRVAIIDDRTAYGAGVADVFAQTAQRLGMQVVGREFTNDKAFDFMTILTKLKALNPEAIFLGSYYTQAAMVARQMKQLNVSGLLIGGDGICTTAVVALGAGELEGRYFCSQSGKPLDMLAGGPAFRERFKKAFNAEIDAYAPAFYVATLAVAQAMQAAGSDDPARVTAALKTLRMDSLLGPVQFDGTGEWVKAPVTIYQISKSNLAPLPAKP